MRALSNSLRIALTVLVACLAGPRPAEAELGVDFVPRRVVFGVGQTDAELIIINRSAQPVTVEAELERIRMNTFGQWEAVTEPTQDVQFADEIVRFAPNRSSLAPGAAQTIRLQRSRPPAGDEARGHISVRLKAADGAVVVKIPLIVKSRPNARAYVRSVRWVSPTAVEVEIDRQGSTSVYGSVELEWARPDGGVEPAERRDVAVYPPLAQRIVTLPVVPKGDGWVLRALYRYADSVARD